MSDSEVLIMGDVHGNWDVVQRLLHRKLRPNIHTILQVGDLGYWPRATQWHEAFGEFLDERNVDLYFADGNHEDHDMLDAWPSGKPLDAAGRIRHVKRGDVVEFGGHRVLFFGGAVSVDKEWRTPGYSWFSRELCDYEEFKKAWEAKDIEYVVAHDLPWVAKPQYPEVSAYWPQYLTAASKSYREQLTGLSERLQPRTWFAGHHHKRLTTDYLDNTVYEVMSCDGDSFERIAAIYDLDLAEWVQDAEDAPPRRGADLARLSIALSAPEEERKNSDE